MIFDSIDNPIMTDSELIDRVFTPEEISKLNRIENFIKKYISLCSKRSPLNGYVVNVGTYESPELYTVKFVDRVSYDDPILDGELFIGLGNKIPIARIHSRLLSTDELIKIMDWIIRVLN